MSEAYKFADVMYFPLGNQSVLLYLKGRSFPRILPSVKADYFLKNKGFLPLAEHLKALTSIKTQGETESDQLNLLEQLIHDRFLVSKNDFLKACSAQNFPSTVEPISMLCFSTRNRVKSLERAVRSYIQNNVKFGRNTPVLVADATPETPIQKQYQQMLEGVKKETGHPINYIGESEKSAFADFLVKEKNIPQDVVHFALFDAEGLGYTYGLNRNLLLLETAGKKMAMFDDDTVCRITEAPGRGQALSILSAVDPTEFCFYPDFQAIQATVPFVEEDILKIHEQLLGKDLRECIQMSESKLNVDQMSPAFMDKIMSANGRVLATMTGVVGDSGMGSVPSYYLTLTGNSRQRLLHSEKHYHDYLKNRQVLRKVNFPTITDGAFWMTISCAMDNRELLPPFLPVLRNEDGLFGLMFRKCVPHGHFGYLPWAVMHNPIEELRISSDDFAFKNLHVNCIDVLIYLVANFEFSAMNTNPSERMKALGEYLMDLGKIPLEDFEMLFLAKTWKAKSEYLHHLESVLKFYRESPDFWAVDVRKQLLSLREGLAQKDFSIPRGLKKNTSDDELRKLNQRMISRFGKLLIYWPEMFQTARELHQNGKCISRAL